MRVKIVLLLAGITAILFFLLQKDSGNIVRIKIGDEIFTVRVAETQSARERGLSGTRALAPTDGMLFEFPTNALHSIWMKDMLIPIDIVWLSDEFLVVDIRENVSPDTFPAIFTPKLSARFVVELSAGAVKAFNIKEGSRAEIFAE